MAVQDKVKLKRPSYEPWSIREQLFLASSVLKAGDQNWMNVSRSLKSFLDKDSLKSPDWFSHKSCAMQYAYMLENTDTPKRKKRESGETANESIVRKLTQERISEINQMLIAQREEYQRLKAEVNLLKSGSVMEDKIQKMWLSIELEEQEQRNKNHTLWLAKRQQKQESQSQITTLTVPRKSNDGSTETSEMIELVGEDDEKKNKAGGRSPLLTSLLKSPSPTTQMQTSNSSAQVTSPTIASLLGSSPKVPISQMAQSVSPQLHQLVSTAIVSSTSERPSAGAPTLSMLLEIPSNVQRTSLAHMHSSSLPSSVIPTQQHVSNTDAQIISPHAVPQTNEESNVPVSQTLGSVSIGQIPNMAVTDNMVQIINQIDNVIPKDIMGNVIDKDEINEIIGDIEELIKEEITCSPQTLDTSNRVMETLNTDHTPTVILSEQRQESKSELQFQQNRIEGVPVPQDSPQSEIAIEEIDSSTSNIAEIIGTVATEPTEPKLVVIQKTATIIENKEKSMVDDKLNIIQPIASQAISREKSNSNEKSKEIISNIDEEKMVSVEKNYQLEETVINNSNNGRECTVEMSSLEAEANTTADICRQESMEKEVGDKEQVQENPAKIDILMENTEKEIETVSKIINISPNEMNNEASTEMFLEKKVEVNEQKNTHEEKENEKDQFLTERNDKCKSDNNDGEKERKESNEDNNIDKVNEEELFKDLEISTSKTLTMNYEEMKKEFEDVVQITSTVTQGVEIKAEILETSKVIKESNEYIVPETLESTEEVPLKIKDEVKDEEEVEQNYEEKERKDIGIKSKEFNEFERKENLLEEQKKVEEVKTEIKEEKTDDDHKISENIKKGSMENIGSVCEDTSELDDEESTLNKISVGRAMKTYSKKQTMAVDSEPENEGSEGADYRAWKKAVMLVYNRLATHKYASVFLRPITEDQAPGYHSIVFRPMDLSTIKKNIDNGTIRSTRHFQRDVMLMFQNAMMYNKQNTFVYKMAVSMQEECLQQMQILVQVTGEATFRRETRTATSSSNEILDISVKRKRSLITPNPHDVDVPRTKKHKKSEND